MNPRQPRAVSGERAKPFGSIPYVGGWVAATCDGAPDLPPFARAGEPLGRVLEVRADGLIVKAEGDRGQGMVSYESVRPCPPPSETGAMGDRQQLPPTPKENK